MSGDGPLRLVLASANPDKVKEISAILSAALPVVLLSRPAGAPDVVEDGETLLDNARLKARALVRTTGTAAVADDTGLEVDALGGAPGVYSARYAGDDATYGDNVTKLLQRVGRAPARRRGAAGSLPHRGAGGVPRRLRGVGGGHGGGVDRHGRAGPQRVRLRPRVRARRRRGPDVRGDAGGREGRGVAPRTARSAPWRGS